MVAAYTVDFQPDFFLGTAPVSVVRSEGFGRVLSSVLGTDRILSEPVSGSVMCKETGLDESAEIKLFPYRWIPGCERLKGWGPVKSRFRPEDLGLILWDVARLGRLRFDLR